MALMSEDDAVRLLQEIAYSHESNFLDLDNALAHCYETGKIARQIAEKLNLDTGESFIAGIFHDVGRFFSKDKKAHTFHEIIGARYIEERGIELDITDSQEQCNRIAQSFRSHAFVSEQFGMEEYKQWLPGLIDTNPSLLLPSSWNELIIVYADLTNIGEKKVGFEERITDIKHRDIQNNSARLKAVERAEPRLLAIAKDLEYALEKGEIDKTKYSIL